MNIVRNIERAEMKIPTKMKVKKHLVGSTFIATRPLLQLLNKENTKEELETYRVYLILYSLYNKKYIHNYKKRIPELQEKTGTTKRGLLKSIDLMLKDNKYAYIDTKDNTTLCLYSKSKIFYNTNLLTKSTKQEDTEKIKRKSYLEFSGEQLKNSKYFIAVVLKLLTDKKKFKALQEFYKLKEKDKATSTLGKRVLNKFFLIHRKELNKKLAGGDIQLCLSLKEIAAHFHIDISSASRLVTSLHNNKLLSKNHNYKEIHRGNLRNLRKYETSYKFKTFNNRTYEQLMNVIDFNFELPIKKHPLISQAETLIQNNLKENERLVNLPIDYYCEFDNAYDFIDLETGESLGVISFESTNSKTGISIRNYKETINRDNLNKRQVKILYVKKNISWKFSEDIIKEYTSKNAKLFYNKLQRELLEEDRTFILNSFYKFEEEKHLVSLLSKYFRLYFKNCPYLDFIDIFKELGLKYISKKNYPKLKDILLNIAISKDDKRRKFRYDASKKSFVKNILSNAIKNSQININEIELNKQSNSIEEIVEDNALLVCL